MDELFDTGAPALRINDVAGNLWRGGSSKSKDGMDALAQAVIRSAPSAVVVIDTEGRVMMMNAMAESMLGTTADLAAGQSYDSVFGASLSERLLGLYLRSVRSGQATTPHSLRATLPGGRAVELKASMGPIRDDEGAMIGLLFVADEAAQAALAQAETDATLVRLRTALRRYVGEGVASMVEERPSFIGVGGIRRHVSVLHADVRGYTTVAEALEPEDTVRLLLRYHGQVVNALLAQGATLDRFIGDSVLAFWNAPDSCEQHARSALIGALAVQRAAGQVGTELGYGIGVHTGDAIVGNLGNENFYNYAAVGDTVNVAARLQSQAGPGEIVCSEQVLSEAGEGIRVSALGSVTVKGRKNPVTMYRVEGVESQEEL